MDFITGAFATWLIEQLADALRGRLRIAIRGTSQQAELRKAANRAIELAAADLSDGDSARTEQLKAVIEYLFGEGDRSVGDEDHPTLVESLKARIASQLSVMGEQTPWGDSSAEQLNVSVEELVDRLQDNLIKQIKLRGAQGGPLHPLADQLNQEAIHLQGIGLKSGVARLESKTEEIHQELIRLYPAPDLTGRNLHVQARRQEAGAWCDQIKGRYGVDFWETEWRQLLHPIVDDPHSLALLAPGGSGKSVLVAHLVEHILEEDNYSCPIVLHRPQDLHGGIDAVARLVGASSEQGLLQFIAEMRTVSRRMLFVVDGLDAMVGATSSSATLEVLRVLAGTGCLVVTCRTELWEQAFSAIGIESRSMARLGEEVIRRVLMRHTAFTQSRLKVLELPFFLNAALTLNYSMPELPSTESEFLEALWNLNCKTPRTPMPRRLSFEPILMRMAEIQLATMSYEVPSSELLSALRNLTDADDALTRLQSVGTIWRQTRAGELTVRLTHDLLDCYSVARLLMETGHGQARRRQVYRQAAEGLGWPLLSMLVQISHDYDDQAVLQEVFAELIGMLDRKRFGDDRMALAWAATYVLRSKIAILAPLVLECLDGTQVASLDHAASAGGSHQGPGACVTQEAASSLAAVLDGLDDWTTGYPRQAISVLSRELERWQLRRRFVDSLAIFHHPATIEALSVFARRLLADNEDLPLLGDIAEAFGSLGEAFTGDTRQTCIDVLNEIADHPGLDPRSLRAAIENKNRLTHHRIEPVPDVEEPEIITFLDPWDKERKSYSDWRIVQKYADLAQNCVSNGKVSPELLAALLAAFTHDHTFARIPVASCLGQIDDPAARKALLTELLRPSLSWDVQQECLRAFKEQIVDAPGSAQQALRRWLVLHAAEEATRSSTHGGAALADLAAKSGGTHQQIVTPGAFEIVPASTTSNMFRATIAEIVGPAEAPITDWISQLVSMDDYAKAGAGIELKYRPVSVVADEYGGLRLKLAPATWEESASFHCAMSRQVDSIRENADNILSPWLTGSAFFPGIVSAHCILITADKKIVMARRPDTTLYAPGSWSISYEEQLTAIDFQSEDHDVATAAAIRGLGEEFGLTTGGHARVLSAIMEFPIINLSLLVAVDTDQTSDAIRRSVAASPVARKEVADLAFVDASPEALLRELARSDLHPTSAIRALAFIRMRQG